MTFEAGKGKRIIDCHFDRFNDEKSLDAHIVLDQPPMDSIIMDSIIRGFEPEPVSVTGYRAESCTFSVGGEAVNGARAASGLGMVTTIRCHLGNDHAGRIIKEELIRSNVNTDLIVRSDHPTPVTTIFVKEVRGSSIREAIGFANACGAICSMGIGAGAAPANREHVLAFMNKEKTISENA